MLIVLELLVGSYFLHFLNLLLLLLEIYHCLLISLILVVPSGDRYFFLLLL